MGAGQRERRREVLDLYAERFAGFENRREPSLAVARDLDFIQSGVEVASNVLYREIKDTGLGTRGVMHGTEQRRPLNAFIYDGLECPL